MWKSAAPKLFSLGGKLAVLKAQAQDRLRQAQGDLAEFYERCAKDLTHTASICDKKKESGRSCRPNQVLNVPNLKSWLHTHCQRKEGLFRKKLANAMHRL